MRTIEQEEGSLKGSDLLVRRGSQVEATAGVTNKTNGTKEEETLYSSWSEGLSLEEEQPLTRDRNLLPLDTGTQTLFLLPSFFTLSIRCV